MVIGDNNGSCTRNLYFALRADGEAYPILPEMKQQLWTLPLVREGKTTDMWYVIQVQGGQEEKTAELIKKQLTLCDDSLRECFIPVSYTHLQSLDAARELREGASDLMDEAYELRSDGLNETTRELYDSYKEMCIRDR